MFTLRQNLSHSDRESVSTHQALKRSTWTSRCDCSQKNANGRQDAKRFAKQ